MLIFLSALQVYDFYAIFTSFIFYCWILKLSLYFSDERVIFFFAFVKKSLLFYYHQYSKFYICNDLGYNELSVKANTFNVPNFTIIIVHLLLAPVIENIFWMSRGVCLKYERRFYCVIRMFVIQIGCKVLLKVKYLLIWEKRTLWMSG